MIAHNRSSLTVDQKLSQLHFNSKSSVSSQIKHQLQSIIPIPKYIPPLISFHLNSPASKPILRIRSPKSRLSLPSTKSSKKTNNTSFNHQQVSLISEFILPNYQHQRIENRNWLMKVISQLSLSRKTLYDTLYFLEEYMKINKDESQSLKVVSGAMLYITCKLEYQNHHSINEILHLIDYQSTKEQLIDLQIKILANLKYKLTPLTLYDRLMYHLHQFQHYQKRNISHLPAINLLSKQYTREFCRLLRMLDTILLSNIHEHYSLDSIVFILIKMVLSEMYESKHQKAFDRIYQSYWKNKYLSLEVYRIKRNINSLLQALMINLKGVKSNQSSQLTHPQNIYRQTYCSELNATAKLINSSVALQVGNT